MNDGIILGTGNSRWMKSAIPEDITHEELVALLRAGTFPFDLNGINEAGWRQLGQALNKASLLKDATAELYGLTSEAVPDDVLVIIKQLTDGLRTDVDAKVITGSFMGTGILNAAGTITIPTGKTPKFCMMGSAESIFGSSGVQNLILWIPGIVSQRFYSDGGSYNSIYNDLHFSYSATHFSFYETAGIWSSSGGVSEGTTARFNVANQEIFYTILV